MFERETLLCRFALFSGLFFDFIWPLIKQGPEYEHDDKVGLDGEYGMYTETGYMEGEEDGELTWFNAGVRVGVGIGLSVCLGIGLGVGLLVKTYQGTTRTFRRRLL